MNADAKAAIAAARSGRCRDAMKHLYDTTPHMQATCSQQGQAGQWSGVILAKDYKHASIIVAGLCTVNKKPGKYKSTGFDGAHRRRRPKRRR